jgi:DNA-binding response OmpR family regulator
MSNFENLCIDPSSPPSCAPRNGAPTVLCVDDDPNISEALGRRLARLGIRTLRAYDGMQGCWLAATEKPDIIVLDVTMPNGNGVEILECLKRNGQTASIPIIVLTGNTDPSLSRRMQKMGANQFLHKPIPFEVLLQEVAAHTSSNTEIAADQWNASSCATFEPSLLLFRTLPAALCDAQPGNLAQIVAEDQDNGT